MIFSTKHIRKIIWGGTSPPQTLPLVGEGDPLPTPHPLGCGSSTPPILKSWVRHTLVTPAD